MRGRRVDPVSRGHADGEARQLRLRQHGEKARIRMRRQPVLVGVAPLPGRIVGHPQGVLGLPERLVEVVRRKIQRRGVERQHALAEPLHGVEVGHHRLPEAGHDVGIGPRVGAAVAHARHHVRMTRRKVALEEVRLDEVGPGRLLHPRTAGHVPVERHVSHVVLVAPHRHLLRQRARVEADALGEDPVDEPLGHAVAVDVIEAHLLQRVAQFAGQPLQGAGSAGQEIGHFQDRNTALRRGVELGVPVRHRHRGHLVGRTGMPSGASVSKALREQARPT